MRDMLKVVCDRCSCELEHVCNPKLAEAATALYRFKPHYAESLKPAMKKSDYYSEGDEKAPFFSEAFLYSLLGKEDARTVLALVSSLLREAGLDPHAMSTRGIAEEIAKEREVAEQQLLREERAREREDEIKPVKETVIDGLKVLTYASFTALDNMLYEHTKNEKKGAERRFEDARIDEKRGVVMLRETKRKVVHEASLDDAMKWTRYHYVAYGRRAEDVWDRYRVGAALKPVLKMLVVDAKSYADADRQPLMKLDEKTLIFENARALDEALFDAHHDFHAKLRKRQGEEAVAKYRGNGKSLTNEDIDHIMRAQAYVNARIQGEYALIDVDGVSYGTLTSHLLAAKPDDTPEGRLLTKGFDRLVRFVKRKAK